MDVDNFLVHHPDLSIISLFEDDESRWQAVVKRNANADGFFVYAVKTTKIFCRPICKARLARRSNVAFFTMGSEAIAAGYRSCKRCRPDLDGFMPEEAAVRKIREFVRRRNEGEAEGGARLSLSQMAKQTGLSKWHFHRVFKKCVGVTPGEYLQREREQQRSHSQQQQHVAATVTVDPQVVFDSIDFDSEVSSSSWSLDDLLVWPAEDVGWI